MEFTYCKIVNYYINFMLVVEVYVSCQAMDAHFKRNHQLDGLEPIHDTSIRQVSVVICSQMCTMDAFCQTFSFNYIAKECVLGVSVYQHSTATWRHYDFTGLSLHMEYISSPMKDWMEALNECRIRGTTLAVLKTIREQQVASSYINSFPASNSGLGTWIGLHFNDTLSWVDGTIPLDKDLQWYPGEPDYLPDKKCIRMSPSGYLKTKSCSDE